MPIEAFGKNRQEYPAKFPELPKGISDSDTFRKMLPEQEKITPH